MKLITMYLPQFHRIRENDEWWGEGFTEWTAVKNARPLFDGHQQPVEPLDNNYYDLLEKDTMRWQAELMKKYHIYGQCIYHYWFKNGRQILEKPAENLLKWKDIDMPFCFSWANETWARSWSAIQNANAWCDTMETAQMKEKSEILLMQEYGEEIEWKEHFEYLLPFFLDKRYIRIDNKPLFLFYKPSDIGCLTKMVSYWRTLAEQAGLDGLYCLGSDYPFASMDGVLARTNAVSSSQLRKGLELEKNILTFQNVWDAFLETKIDTELPVYYQGIVAFDDTPRRGTRGMIIKRPNKQLFKTYLGRLFAKSFHEGREFVFLNAWNEWGEGMYLEPSKDGKYEFLEAIGEVIEEERYKENVLLTEYEKPSTESKRIEDLQYTVRRYQSFWQTLDKWLALNQKGKSLISFFRGKGYKKIAVYGLGMLCKHLIADLKNSEIEITYGIDLQGGNEITFDFRVYGLDEELPGVDAVIVTVLYDFDMIYTQLESKVEMPIISLGEIIETCETI